MKTLLAHRSTNNNSSKSAAAQRYQSAKSNTSHPFLAANSMIPGPAKSQCACGGGCPHCQRSELPHAEFTEETVSAVRLGDDQLITDSPVQATASMDQQQVKSTQIGEIIQQQERPPNPQVETKPFDLLVQRKASPDAQNNAPDRPLAQAPKEEYNKPELEFHSALHFNLTLTGFNPTGEPKEGEFSVIWWHVWNTGWKTAPEHTNRLTIYDANPCSGCREEKDIIFRSEMSAPSIVPGFQAGQSEYESSALIPTLSVGHYEAYAELDIKNEVEEINEDNNSAFMNFVVRPSDQSEPAD
jgi:hypothetical protein